MYISNLKIKNFRAIKNLDLNLNKGLNVLIGENNSGKNNGYWCFILSFKRKKYPKNIHWKESDFRVDTKPIEIDIQFKPTNNLECAWFSELHHAVLEGNKFKHYLELHYEVNLIKNKSKRKFKRKIWGGKDKENNVPPEILEALNCIYLDPLRDVNKNFKPNRYNLLAKLFANIMLDPDEKKDKIKKEKLIKKIEGKFKSEESWSKFIDMGKDAINSHLEEMSFNKTSNGFNMIDINFSTFDIEDLVSKMILQIPVGKDYFDLNQNGFGYNNLIYAATIFGDMLKCKESFKEDYNLLLIEEPEAHLHPQLESTFFKYLNKLDKKENFQIIVSSHSPVITAKTKLKNVIILQNVKNSIVSTAIKDIPLDEDNIMFLEKFLDVTKSQLFFSKGIILVEGISEALLLSTFAKIMGIQLKDNENYYDLERNGIEVIITGISFSHYAKLFNNNDKNKRLNFRCSIITDKDEHKDKVKNSRINNLKKLEKNNLRVFYTKNTLEWALYDDNKNVILEVFKETHPKIIGHTVNEKDFDGRILVNKLENNQSKSDFAYNLFKFLSDKLEESCIDEFKVPEYIENAIKFVVGEDIEHWIIRRTKKSF